MFSPLEATLSTASPNTDLTNLLAGFTNAPTAKPTRSSSSTKAPPAC